MVGNLITSFGVFTFTDDGIVHRFTTPFSPEQSRSCERENRTIAEIQLL